MRPIGLPVERKPFAGLGDFDNLGIDIKAGATAEFHLVIALCNLKVAPICERLHIAALGPKAPIGNARGQNADEARIAPPAKHIAHSLLTL